MSLRNYANAPATTLNGSVTNVATSIVVTSATGYPISYPYTLIIDRGTATEEAVSVTAAAGTTLTVTRAIDSTTAFAHSSGAAVEHGITAQDIREPNSHINSNSGVHGVTGSVVGTTDTQAVTNKTLGTTNTINGFTASRFMEADGTGKLVSGTKVIPTGTVVGTTDTQALTNKDLTGAGNTFPTTLATLAGAQALTNKDLTSGTNTFPTSLVTLTGAQAVSNKTISNSDLTGTGIGTFVGKYKSADQNTASTTYIDDNTLTIPTVANGVYLFTCQIKATAASGLTWGFFTTSGSGGLFFAATIAGSLGMQGTTPNASAISTATGNSFFSGIYVAPTGADNLLVRFKAAAGTATISTGSFMSLVRIA